VAVQETYAKALAIAGSLESGGYKVAPGDRVLLVNNTHVHVCMDVRGI
jgi:hypothetical protein